MTYSERNEKKNTVRLLQYEVSFEDSRNWNVCINISHKGPNSIILTDLYLVSRCQVKLKNGQKIY